VPAFALPTKSVPLGSPRHRAWIGDPRGNFDREARRQLERIERQSFLRTDGRTRSGEEGSDDDRCDRRGGSRRTRLGRRHPKRFHSIDLLPVTGAIIAATAPWAGLNSPLHGYLLH
jgi:hypothetical protein